MFSSRRDCSVIQRQRICEQVCNKIGLIKQNLAFRRKEGEKDMIRDKTETSSQK